MSPGFALAPAMTSATDLNGDSPEAASTIAASLISEIGAKSRSKS
jgi:hypothetical protein